MAVNIECFDHNLQSATWRERESRRWVIEAKPDSGRAYWKVEVWENSRARNPLAPVLRALRRATKIDYEFSLEAIEKRSQRREKRKVATRLLRAVLEDMERESLKRVEAERAEYNEPREDIAS